MEHRRKQNAVPAVLPAIIAVAALCLIAFLIAGGIVNRGSGTLRDKIELPARSTYQTAALGSGVLYNDGATLHAINSRGRQIWSYGSGTGGQFRISSGGVAVWTNNLLTLLDSKTGATYYSGRLDETILDACLGEIYAAVQLGTEHESTIVLLETSGKRIDSIDMSGKTVLDFGFFSDGALFWIMVLDTEGTIPACSVYTYRPGKTMAGSITDTNQVLYEVLFQQSLVRVVGTTHIKDFDYTGKELADNRMLVYGWYLMGMDEESEDPLMVFAPSDAANGGKGVQDIRLIRGGADESVRLPYAATKLLASGDSVYALNNHYVMVATLGKKDVVRYELPMYVDSVLGITNDHTIIATYNGTIWLIPLP